MASDALTPDGRLSVTAERVSLRAGCYAFTLVGRSSRQSSADVSVHIFQTLHAPEVLPKSAGRWLTRIGERILFQTAETASVVFTTYKKISAGNEPGAAVRVERLDEPFTTASQIQASVMTHIQREGDRFFPLNSWAGGRTQGRWIEALAIHPSDGLSAPDIEYKALLGNGGDTGWRIGGSVCGSRGKAVPIIAFAIRLRGMAADLFNCEYQAVFVDGSTSPRSQNGQVCFSTVVGTPVAGIHISFSNRQGAGEL